MTSSAPIELDYRPSYLAAFVASLAVFGLYLLTLGPSTAMWDTSEYIAAAYVVGLPHPPGNPMFVLLGRFFTLLPIAESIAARVNILAAVCSAASAGFWFLITERVLVSWLPERRQRIFGASLAALIGATAFTVWAQSVVNEKVYTVSLVGLALVAWLTVRWCDDPDGRKADRILVLIAYVLGLGYANHMAGMLAAPAVGLAVLLRRPVTLLRWKLLLACVGAIVLGLTPFATQPIRAAYFPAINEGEPTACRDALTFECTFSEGTTEAFKYNFNREQYGKPSVLERQAPIGAQIGMWWLYFKWQWLRDAHLERPGLQNALAAVFLMLGFIGGWVHWKRDRQSFLFFGPLMFTMTLLLIYYLNFKYGYSQSPDLGESVAREVRDRDYFYLWSFSAWSVWAALGLIFVWESTAALIGRRQVTVGREQVELPTNRGWMLASPVLLIALVPLFGNWSAASRHNDTTTRDFAHDLLNSVEPYGILVTVGDNDTFPLWYAQEVEGIRPDVIVANTSLLNTEWYTRQLIRNPVREYDAAAGPAIYRNQQWTKPDGPPVDMTMDEADAVPLAVDLRETMLFEAGNIQAQITPRIIQRADIFVLRLIKDNPDRPVYFSRTSGGYGQDLGLGPYLLTQGLARRLVRSGIPTPGPDTLLIPGEGFVDLKRTTALWDSVFMAPKSLIERGDWVDRASVGIPALYVSTGFMLADALDATGSAEKSKAVLNLTEQVAQATRLSDLFQANREFQERMRQLDSPTALPIPLAPAESGRVP
ncbi:MAG TPA: DUF2723 domain-containing protein [Gemmatimonadaceae bacterium]|nr:DUF2723 domain-containing protein [Gemmatimonadaceae bacterium]